MRKQDRTYSRTPTDLEHKYNLGKNIENVANQSAKIEKIDRTLTQFAAETNIEIQKLKGHQLQQILTLHFLTWLEKVNMKMSLVRYQLTTQC